MKFYLAVIFICSALQIHAQNWVVGTTYYTPNTYVEYIFGNMPIIISTPHGGILTPSNIPNRTDALCGTTITTVTDSNTDDLARALDTSLRNLMGCRPHTIICRLERTKLDMNREINEAACGNAIAITTWNNYHAMIDTARKYIIAKFGRGLFIDLHGHGHPTQRHEIGYLLSASDLRASDTYINSASTVASSSIRSLVANNNNNFNHVQLLKGTTAFGTLLANAGYPSVPSQQDTAPAAADEYFNGGYNTLRWGSTSGGLLDALQIETNFTGVRNTTANIKKFADSLARVIKRYIEFNMMSPTQLNQCQTATGIFNVNYSQKAALFSFYPNPSYKGVVVVNLLQFQPKTIVTLTDINGRLLLKNTVYRTNSFTLLLPPTAKGNYFIKIEADKKTDIQKIFIAK